MRDELGPILEAVTTGVETQTGDAIEHRYLRARETEEGPGSWYGIDFRRIEKDQKMIESILQAAPDMAPDLQSDLHDLQRALGEYARVDPSLPMDRWGLIKPNGGTEKVLGMARVAGIIAATAAAVFTGVLALARKEGFQAPLLYAGIAGLLASPELRRSLFGSKADNLLAEIDTTVNSSAFKESVRDYNIAGTAWRSFAEDVMHNPGDTRKLINVIQRHQVTSSHSTEAIDEYVRNAMPAGKEQDQLRAMIMDGRFPTFAARLMDTKNADARDVILEYIGRGAGRFEGMAKKSAAEVNNLFETQSKLGYH